MNSGRAGRGADVGCRCSTRRTSALFPGKASVREDIVNVRFAVLAPPRRIVEGVSLVTTDPAFFGEMTITAPFEEVSGGTEVTLVFENLAPGLRAEDD
jgi:hypothetical protein